MIIARCFTTSVLVVAEAQALSVEEQIRRLQAIPPDEWRKPFDDYSSAHRPDFVVLDRPFTAREIRRWTRAELGGEVGVCRIYEVVSRRPWHNSKAGTIRP